MGYGEYSHAAHIAITQSRPAAAPTFASFGAHPLLNPKGATREARDSADHPSSLALAFALDVTGSMGEIPRQLAGSTLPSFMSVLLEAGVRDPQLCFLAVGHAAADAAPLQVGQFESTAALIDGWLTRLWLEGGGGKAQASYELAMYFAARRMRLDCAEKRGRRGFLFITGDVGPTPAVSRAEVARLIGDHLDDDIPIRVMIEELQRSFEPFFLLAPTTPRPAERAWRDLLGDRVVRLQAAEDAAFVAGGLVALLEGAAPTSTAYVDRLVATGLPRRNGARVAVALAPFAASIGRDGAPGVGRQHPDLPTGDPPSGLAR